MSSLLITGATGYIGGKLVQFYLEKGEDVRLLVRDKTRLSPDLRRNCSFVEGDVTHLDTLMEAVRGVDAVIHSAGLLGRWGLSYRRLYEVNVQGAETLIRAAFDAGVRRFIQLSAGGVTGPLGPDPADETYPPRPGTDYERSKWEGEKRALNMAEKDDLNLLVVRPTFTYGPGDPHKLNFFRSVMKGRFAFVGSGHSTVHPVYIDDLISGIDLGLKSGLKKTTVIIGGPGPVTKRELVYGIADALGAPRPRLRLPIFLAEILARGCEISARVFKFEPLLTRSRVLALSRNWGYSIARAREELGYQPQIDLAEGLRRTVAWYREQGWL